MQDVLVAKDENRELPIPTEWRGTLKFIADAFVSGSIPAGNGIREMRDSSARGCLWNIAQYPDQLGPLSDRAWDTSVYIWMESYWEALVDLSKADGGRSDLVLHARIYELGDQVEFEPGLIYVP